MPNLTWGDKLDLERNYFKAICDSLLWWQTAKHSSTIWLMAGTHFLHCFLSWWSKTTGSLFNTQNNSNKPRLMLPSFLLTLLSFISTSLLCLSSAAFFHICSAPLSILLCVVIITLLMFPLCFQHQPLCRQPLKVSACMCAWLISSNLQFNVQGHIGITTLF